MKCIWHIFSTYTSRIECELVCSIKTSCVISSGNVKITWTTWTHSNSIINNNSSINTWASAIDWKIQYNREQKHMLLFRKSETLFLKSRLLACRIFFFRNKTFLFLKIEIWNIQHFIDLGFRQSSQNFSSIGQLLFFGAHVTNWIQIQLVTWGVTNQDVLLLVTIR